MIGFAIATGAGAQDAPRKPLTKEEVLTDAAIVAVIIAASIAAYKAMGKPCACPNDTMRNGASCGNRSAYAKPGGFRPLCYATDITADMIKNYRTAKVVPGLR
ncbi:MAG: hypothetical protein ACOYLQ_09360 [Hyphomicrobiaceae bacterium]